MATRTIFKQGSKDKKLIDFQADYMDYGHFIVNRICENGSEEPIGHVFTEIDGEEVRYISTGRTGRTILLPTTDFNEVEAKFEWLAHLYAIQEHTINHEDYYLNHYSLTKNLNTMQTQSQTPEKTQKKMNQLIFVEYEKATGDGHFITVVDSYRNVIGRIHKSYNDQTKKYDHIAYDHAGTLIGQNERLWELKKEFTNNRDVLLEQAHQRRIASKEKVNETPEQVPQNVKTEERKVETEKLRENKKTQEKSIGKTQGKAKTATKEKTPSTAKQSKQEEREDELQDLREDKGDDRGDMDIAY